jgi:hypothetical protein
MAWTEHRDYIAARLRNKGVRSALSALVRLAFVLVLLEHC